MSEEWVFPPLLHVYSVWLALRTAFDSAGVSARGRRLLWGAVLIDLAIFWLVLQVVTVLVM